MLALGACSADKPPATQPIVEPMPVPYTPAKALQTFAWCWNHRDFERYSEVFTGDYSGDCPAADSAGTVFHNGPPLTREDELESARRLFADAGIPAGGISLQFDPDPIPESDPRPASVSATYYRDVTTRFDLRIDNGSRDFHVAGRARFRFVRGDVAAIPPELSARGFRPDATRWYVERWEDLSVEAPMQTQETTWCSVRAVYR